MRGALISSILIVAGMMGAVHAGWSEDIRLTYRFLEMEPQVIARNDTVHVVWQQVAGPMHISYMRSIDGGNEWDSLVNLEEVGHIGARQDFSLFPDGMFVGWFDEDTSDFTTYIAYSRSSDGSVWSAPEYISHDVIRMYDLGTTAFRDSIYAIYCARASDSTHTHPLRFLYSSDWGATWSAEVTVGHVDEYTNFLHMAHCKNSLYVVWASDLAPLGFYREVMATVSHDGGQSWTEVTQLSSPDTAVAQHTCITCDEGSGNFAVGWMDYGLSVGFPGDLYVRITTDEGYSWLPESHATGHHGVWSSSLAMVEDTLWAVWTDVDYFSYGDGNEEVCFSKSTNLGASWNPYERLTFALGHSMSPGIAHDNGKLHVVWYDRYRPPDSTGHSDIYYKRYEPEVRVDDEEIIIPNKTYISAYPNPFNSTTILTYSNMEGGEIAIYNIRGQRIREYQIAEEEGQIIWDACDAKGNKISSGIYFAKAKAPQSSQVVKLIYLK